MGASCAFYSLACHIDMVAKNNGLFSISEDFYLRQVISVI